ncbi:MAG TPA: co-chaperone GroES family protein [Bacteroidales bacterium]|nr:co-chaperone GroES family protein [Bacteroidales bacterium]HPI31262.1 co-chaperone GroES family protein [Bacteroidales bacterium]HQN16900.1 co-chaperone GroES family protein [Bacteroidales bacterium]HQP16562.1 co-chaperone GroES family protein [Bacteroidales bacterium]
MNIKLGNIKKLIVVGDRVLIKKTKSGDRTKTGLLLPPGVTEKEDIQTGYVIKTGPGYPIPFPQEDEEHWKESDKKVKYLPLQAKEGDMVIYLQNQAYEIEFDKEKFYLVPNSAILLLYRDE